MSIEELAKRASARMLKLAPEICAARHRWWMNILKPRACKRKTDRAEKNGAEATQ